jgi:Ni/Co efflux regulator RcnB
MMIMKKLSLSILLLATVASPSFARDSACADYRICKNQVQADTQVNENALRASGTEEENGEWKNGRYGMSRDAKEIRRWNEKND